MARAPFRPVELDVAFRPVAAPVDTFVRAQEPSRDSSLQDLARSLSVLGGSLGGLVGQRDKQAEEDEKIRGEAAFWSANGIGSAEAVSKGLIPAQAAPGFMRAYKRLEGEVAGGQLEQKFSAAYDAWEGKTSTDPKAYDAFVGGFIRDSIQTSDPDILRGLLPKVHQVATNYLQRHIGDASRATMAGATTALSAKQDQAIADASTVGLSSRQGTDYAGVFNSLDAIRAEGLKTGLNEEEVDKKLLDTVTARAITLRDPKLLDFLDRKVPGKDYAWSSTPYGRDQRQKTIDTLETMGRRSIADDEKRRREEHSALKDGVTRDTIGWITQHANEPIPEELLARGEKVDPDFRVSAIRWRDTIAKAGQTSDPAELQAVYRDLLNGGGLPRVKRAMDDLVFKNPEDLTKAAGFAKSMKEQGPALTAILGSDQSKTIERTIRERTLRQDDGSSILDPDGMSDTGLAARHDYRMQLLAWMAANPNADAIKQQEAIAKIGAAILGRLGKNDDGDRTYDRAGLDQANPFPGRAPGATMEGTTTTVPNPLQPPAPTYGNRDVQVPSGLPGIEEAPQPKAAPTPSKMKTTYDGAARWYRTLSPEVQAHIKTIATREGITEREVSQRLHQKALDAGMIVSDDDPSLGPNAKKPAAPSPAPGKQSSLRAPDGTPIETASAATDDLGRAFGEAIDTPPPAYQVRLIGEAFERAIAGAAKGKPVGGYVSAQLRDDPRAARILDFVAGPESGGNYNAFYGNGRSTKDLSAMTLDHVMVWSRNRGTASSATGRYQFMAKTLRGLKEEMGLSGSEPFTPALQDRLALQLLERRGYSAWRAGRLTDAQFANRLALEWASLPNVTAQNGRPAGFSAYAGDGLNKSLVSPASVMAALRGDGSGFLGRLFGRGRRMPAPQRPDNETNV